MKLRFCLLFFGGLIITLKSSAKTDSLKFERYFKIGIGGFNPYQTKIENFNSGKILENYKTPGVNISFQSEYQKEHLFFSSGINFRILPTGYKFTIRNADLFNRENYIFDFEDKISEYFYGIYSIPLVVGYQTKSNKSNQRLWLNGGIEINSIRSGELRSSFLYDDENSNTYSVVEFTSISDTKGPNAKYFLTYHLGLGLTSLLKGGNQFRYALRLNISNQNIIDGRYQVNLNDRVETGTFRDNGSFYGFEVSYSFKKNKIKYK